VLLGSCLVLILTLLGWLLSPLLKRAVASRADASEFRRLRLLLRSTAAFEAIYLVAWLLLLRPVLTLDLQVYRGDLDLVVRALQVAGVLAVAAAVLGIWSGACRDDVPKRSRVWGFLVAASLLGVVWIAFIGGLLRFA
jgi:hypothetical protein